jgi:hypothetical protein
VSPVRYGLGLYIPEDDILHSHRRGNLKSYNYSHTSLNKTQFTDRANFPSSVAARSESTSLKWRTPLL